MKIKYFFRILPTIVLFSFILIILTCTVDTVNGGDGDRSQFAYLESLEVTPGTLTPDFSYNIEVYTITHTSPISSASIVATGYGLSDVITIDDLSQQNSCTKVCAFEVGENPIDISVKNISSGLNRIYMINYKRPDVTIPVIAALNTVPDKEWHCVKPTIAVDVTDNYDLSYVKLLHYSTEIKHAIVDGTSDNVTFDISSVSLVQGDNTFTVIVSDSDSNTATDTIVVKWDDILPVVPTDGTYSLNPDGTTWDYEVSITEEGSNFTDTSNISITKDNGSTYVDSLIYNGGTQKWDLVIANAKVTVTGCSGPVVVWSLNSITATDNAGNAGVGTAPQSGGIGPDANVSSENFQITSFE